MFSAKNADGFNSKRMVYSLSVQIDIISKHNNYAKYSFGAVIADNNSKAHVTFKVACGAGCLPVN